MSTTITRKARTGARGTRRAYGLRHATALELGLLLFRTEAGARRHADMVRGWTRVVPVVDGPRPFYAVRGPGGNLERA